MPVPAHELARFRIAEPGVACLECGSPWLSDDLQKQEDKARLSSVFTVGAAASDDVVRLMDGGEPYHVLCLQRSVRESVGTVKAKGLHALAPVSLGSYEDD